MKSKTKKIAHWILNIHQQKGDYQEAEIPLMQLKRYIAYCKSKCSPRLTQAVAEMLKNHYVNIRSTIKGKDLENATKGPNVIPITVRQLEAIIRLSESYAKMTLSPSATEQHVNDAIHLFKVSTFEAATSGVSVSEALSPQLVAEVGNAEQLLKRRLPIGSQISVKQVVDDFTKQGVTSFAIRKAIEVMVQRDELEFRAQKHRIYRKY